MKVCSKCKLELDESCFHKRSRGGLACYCKPCRKEYAKQYNRVNREARLTRGKQYYLDNKAMINAKHRRHWQANKDYLLTKAKQRYLANKEHVQAIIKKSYHKNKKAYQERIKLWKETHKEYRRQYQAIYIPKRERVDLNYKIARRLRCRFAKAIKNQAKAGSAVRDLGVSIPDFKVYIEAQFREGMTWENWGKVWHLDHIKPLVSFDLTDREQFLIASNWTNYQPLLVLENLSKGSKYTII